MKKTIHMPMEHIKGYTKICFAEYLRTFRHSDLAKKLFMCCYWRNAYERGYLSLSDFFIESKRRAKDKTDKALIDAWGIDRPYKSTFFGFDIETVRNGTINDVENMIINWIITEKKHITGL